MPKLIQCNAPECRRPVDTTKSHVTINELTFHDLHCANEYLAQVERFARAADPFHAPVHDKRRPWWRC